MAMAMHMFITEWWLPQIEHAAHGVGSAAQGHTKS